MKSLVHGGDIYSFAEKNPSKKAVDFSANINPLGMPESVRQAIMASIEDCASYPDPLCRELREAIFEAENIPKEWIFCGNGAADVLFRLAHALRPKKAVIPAPTFSEYAASLVNIDCKIKFHSLSESDSFEMSDRILDDIDDETDIVYLCNPNNPTGKLIDMNLLEKILERCVDKGSFLLIDECFNDFLSEHDCYTFKNELKKSENLIILRAFTKIYAIPGVRLGYCMTSNEWLMEMLYASGQPWNVSVIAQKCGVAALKDVEFPKITRDIVKKEREFLVSELKTIGFEVFDPSANYIFFKNTKIEDLQDKLEKHGILIRSCANYSGLDDRFFRIAVKNRIDNEFLIETMKKVISGKEEM